ncbi:MAG: GNAT family N-acetyltransferase [Chloroflexaceae bacterium]|nr:GNAT family N-acetyltransferase [Chloroflexaceae bacterium]NJO83470.1 GNAT family N-acetyltransferase [Blastochloris sp.]
MGVADGVVVGSVGVKRYPPNAAEIKRLYLAAAQRGKGWGRRLLEWSIGWAQAQHVQTITAWSDTRFTDAHRLYLRSGFTQDAERVLEDDPNDSREYRFVRNF